MTAGMAIIGLIALAADKGAAMSVGPARIELKIDRANVSLIEFVSIRVVATAPLGTSVERPTFQSDPERVSGFSTKSFGPDTIDGRNVWIWEIEVEPLEPGRLALPPLVVRVEENGAVSEGALPVPTIEVTSDPNLQGDASELREMPAPPTSPRRRLGKVLRWSGILLLIAVGGFAILARRRTSTTSSARQALGELAEIEKQPTELWTLRARAQAACDVLRRHLERQYSLPTSRQTTVEFLSDSGTAELLSEPARSHLAKILPLADLERFGSRGPTQSEWRELLESIRAFLSAERPS